MNFNDQIIIDFEEEIPQRNVLFLFQITKSYFMLTLMLNMATGAKILGVFMMDSFSHFNIQNAIMETLAMAGHEVTVISSFKPQNPVANTTYIQVRERKPKHVSSWSQSDLKSISLWKMYKVYQKTQEEDCELLMALNETKVSACVSSENPRMKNDSLDDATFFFD